MKNLVLFFTLIVSTILNAQSPIGAWEFYSVSPKGDQLKSVVIFAEGYQAVTTYHALTGAFLYTNGGTWSLEGNTMTETIEFDSSDPDRVGTQVSFKVEISENEIQIVNDPRTFRRIDNGTPGALQGAWLMSGRIRDGKTQMRDISRPRKTMKILSGTRFQWIAYNTETKEFKGSGGGTYTTKNGVYTEQIEFFSRDDAKAGLSLKFDYELIEGNWHHKGFSSKGDPIHEIWTKRQ